MKPKNEIEKIIERVLSEIEGKRKKQIDEIKSRIKQILSKEPFTEKECSEIKKILMDLIGNSNLKIIPSDSNFISEIQTLCN